MTVRLNPWILAICSIGLVVASAISAPPPGKGKDKNAPPVLYQVEFFAAPNGGSFDYGSPEDANNNGQAVGSYWLDTDGDGSEDTRRAFIYGYDPQQPTLTHDLNSLVGNVRAGFAIRNATAINERGDIVVYLEPVGSPAESLQAAMIDMSATPPVLHEVPDGDITGFSLATDLNERGDLVARYQRGDGSTGAYVYNFGLYNPGWASTEPVDVGVDADSVWPSINDSQQVAGGLSDGSAYRATLGGVVISFPSLESATSINNAGEFCGRTLVAKNKKGNVLQYHAYVASGDDPPEVDIFESHPQVPIAINQSGDNVSVQKLNHRQLGQFRPEDLLDPSDPKTTFWHDTRWADVMSTLTDRDAASNFPTIFGHGTFEGTDLGIIFVPIPAP